MNGRTIWDRVRANPRLLLAGVGTVYVGWLASMLATATASLAKNWLVVLLATVPGVVVAGTLALGALGEDSTRHPTVSTSLASSRLHVRFLRAVADLVDWADDHAPAWILTAGAGLSVLTLLGTSLGLLLGGPFDSLRISLLESGSASPGRTLLVGGALVLIGFGIATLLDAEDWRYLLLGVSMLLVVAAFAVGVRRWVGVYPEAKQFASEVTDGAVVKDAFIALMTALDEPRPDGHLADPGSSDYVVVAGGDLATDPTLWTATPLVFRGAVEEIKEVRTARAGTAIRLVSLRSDGGVPVAALLWFNAGDTVSCPELVIWGQLLSTPTSQDQRPTLLGVRWQCSLPELRSPDSIAQSDHSGYWATVRAFTSVRTLDEIEEVVKTVRSAYNGIPLAVGAFEINWTGRAAGSAVFVGPYATFDETKSLCDSLRSWLSNDNPKCFPLYPDDTPSTIQTFAAAA